MKHAAISTILAAALVSLASIAYADDAPPAGLMKDKSASAGKLCPVCDLSPFGVETLGLVSMTRSSAKAE